MASLRCKGRNKAGKRCNQRLDVRVDESSDGPFCYKHLDQDKGEDCTERRTCDGINRLDEKCGVQLNSTAPWDRPAFCKLHQHQSDTLEFTKCFARVGPAGERCMREVLWRSPFVPFCPKHADQAETSKSFITILPSEVIFNIIDLLYPVDRISLALANKSCVDLVRWWGRATLARRRKRKINNLPSLKTNKFFSHVFYYKHGPFETEQPNRIHCRQVGLQGDCFDRLDIGAITPAEWVEKGTQRFECARTDPRFLVGAWVNLNIQFPFLLRQSNEVYQPCQATNEVQDGEASITSHTRSKTKDLANHNKGEEGKSNAEGQSIATPKPRHSSSVTTQAPTRPRQWLLGGLAIPSLNFLGPFINHNAIPGQTIYQQWRNTMFFAYNAGTGGGIPHNAQTNCTTHNMPNQQTNCTTHNMPNQQTNCTIHNVPNQQTNCTIHNVPNQQPVFPICNEHRAQLEAHRARARERDEITTKNKRQYCTVCNKILDKTDHETWTKIHATGDLEEAYTLPPPSVHFQTRHYKYLTAHTTFLCAECLKKTDNPPVGDDNSKTERKYQLVAFKFCAPCLAKLSPTGLARAYWRTQRQIEPFPTSAHRWVMLKEEADAVVDRDVGQASGNVGMVKHMLTREWRRGEFPNF